MKLLTKSKNPVDRIFFVIVVVLLVVGLFIFSSASLGLIARGTSFTSIAFKQFSIGIVGGGMGAYLLSRIHYRNLRRIAFWFFILSLIATALVFIPGFGFTHGGATRWISLGSFTFQPAEFLKLGTVLYVSALFSSKYLNVHTLKEGFLPMVGILAVIGALLLKQPDTGTFAVIAVTVLCMFLVAGGRWSHALLLVTIGAVGLFILAITKPYIADRLMTFVNPAEDALGSSYQVQQALTAIGSGELFGRGFGQSVQKFNLLPEPVGDSIFAVAGEEFGFIGSTIIILLFVAFTLRGLHLAGHAPDSFSRLLIVGIVILIASQSFVNIAAMLGIVPLTGVPLLFISQGGTALFAALLGVGIILNISRYRR